jgi:protein O-GlcNAc transferase
VDYQRFIEQLPGLYANWGHASVHPHVEAFNAVLDQVRGTTTANVMQLLNFAVECLAPGEVYCQVGGKEATTFIGALLHHPEQMAYAVDNLVSDDEEKLEQLSKNLSLFDLEQQVIFANQEIEEFFFDLREIQPEEKIGIYYYAGVKDYRTQLLGLTLVTPFLAEQALIIVDDSNYSSVQQACWDFMAAHRECQLLLDLPTPQDGDSTWGNGLQVFSWDVTQEAGYTWSTFAESFHNQPFIKALADFSFDFEFNQKKQVVESLEKQALALDLGRHFVEAEKKYKEILQWDRNHANACHNLGMVYYQMERYQDALEQILRAVAVDPSIGLRHYSLGLVLEKLGNIEQAVQAYQDAINLNPQLVDAYNNLGNILSTAGKIQQAESVYRQAITANPQHFGSYLNLGNLLMARQQVDEAITAYKTALRYKQRHSDILSNLAVAFEAKKDEANALLYSGHAYYRSGKYESAIIQYKKFIENKIGDVDVYIALAECYECLNQYESAIKVYEEAIKLYPNEAKLYFWLAMDLQELGRTQSAIKIASSAVQLLPNDLALKLAKQLMLPLLYENTEEIKFYRNRFSQGLDELIQTTLLSQPENRSNALKSIGFWTNFHLQYQGENDLELQTFYGHFVHRIMVANYPEWTKPLTIPRIGDEKIRVGYVSAHMKNHTVAKLTLGWLKNHNRKNFEIYCYYTGWNPDSITQQFQGYSDAFKHIPENLKSVCQQIVDDKLHIVVYTDVGMHPRTTQMAGLRLAPVQCTSWGHPITSGLPTIDYYLSSELMEPENAEEHYSEKLILLPKLGISYAKPVLPETIKNRSYFGLNDDAVVYLCCQSLFKYLPQYDYILAAIAKRVPQAKFAFIEFHIIDSIKEKFCQRLQKAFASMELDSKEYCLMLPRLNQTDFLNLNKVSDIFLDTFSWSGGNTTLEAIACNLPVVTCPGEFMRGRHSYGILKMLGVTQTIAKDEAEYIEIAVRLGLDKQWRQSIIQQITQNHDRLYDDKTCVEALEAFYQRVVQEGQASN